MLFRSRTLRQRNAIHRYLIDTRKLSFNKAMINYVSAIIDDLEGNITSTLREISITRAGILDHTELKHCT